ncbi:ATP-binding protein [Deinococcus sp. QL22]|uniref:ATP-binding protein n=1 Tax=Deinococcus sp. QL22 TaxID=2939437 RepID=UPI00201755D3|nr:ATP-binding protein [Deinococcus sp. QL22]UQN08671.1 GAF domain-containing protein [Deinococcus sp. QL22]
MTTDAGLLLPTSLGGPVITSDNCAREPIQIPGSIQPHGALLTVDARTLEILQVSANSEAFLGAPPAALRGTLVGALLPDSVLAPLFTALPEGSPDHLQYRTLLPLLGTHTALTAHRVADLLVLEFEASQGHDPTGSQELRNAVFALESAPSLARLTQVAAESVRQLTGFDRVMVYRFAEDASGEVVAEARRVTLPAFLGHRFPESDIPSQARALYVRHLLRLTADTEAESSPLEPRLNPQTGQPTPLGGAVLRVTSPMHLQYLRNMGVTSSLSVSIVVDGQLWGLMACHHETALVVPPDTRTALEYLGRLLNLQVQLKARADTDAFRARVQQQHAHILEATAHSVAPLETFADERLDLEGLMRATGVIMFFEGRWQARGRTPTPGQVEALLAWLRTQEGTIFQTDSLLTHWPPAADCTAVASGLLAISVGRGWAEGIIWLRPAISVPIVWGGATPEQAKDGLGPRRSFETYIQTVQGRAEAWHAGERQEAHDLQVALTTALGARLSVVRGLNAALERSNAEWRQYAFVIAHDMQEPVRLISQFVELFHLRYHGQVDAHAEQIFHFLITETARLRSLTHDLHRYTALLSAPPLIRKDVELGQVVQSVLGTLAPQILMSGAQMSVAEPLPVLFADPVTLRDLLQQLVHNALVFGGPNPQVRIEAVRVLQAWEITVRDQGVGIAPEYQEKIFGLFQRLGRREDSPGNGIGLALGRKIAEHHGGTLRLTSTLGLGSILTFHLPDVPVLQERS